ncbi:unnamed protein product, partial [Pleuronectes platessa]
LILWRMSVPQQAVSRENLTCAPNIDTSVNGHTQTSHGAADKHTPPRRDVLMLEWLCEAKVKESHAFIPIIPCVGWVVDGGSLPFYLLSLLLFSVATPKTCYSSPTTPSPTSPTPPVRAGLEIERREGMGGDRDIDVRPVVPVLVHGENRWTGGGTARGPQGQESFVGHSGKSAPAAVLGSSWPVPSIIPRQECIKDSSLQLNLKEDYDP